MERLIDIEKIKPMDFPSTEMDGLDVVQYLNTLPTVDAVKVVHGRWLTWEEQFPGEKPRRSNNLGVFCDTCHNHADNRTDFCPICGARMDGGDGNG